MWSVKDGTAGNSETGEEVPAESLTEETGILTPSRKKLLISAAITVAVLLSYYVFVRLTGVGIPCVFHLVTRLKCPGCGISRMLLALAKLDFRTAFVENRFLLLSLPFLGFELVFEFLRKWKGEPEPQQNTQSEPRHTGTPEPKWNQMLLLIYCVLLISFGVVRNIWGW